MRPLHLSLAVAVALLLALRVGWLPWLNVNWDEFLYLARVHELARGELASGFQTFHTRLFAWLPGLGGEVDQVIAARWVMFALAGATAAGVFALARALADTTAAWFAVLLALGVSNVLRHGESFRADPMLAFLFVASAVLLVLRPGSARAAAAAGAAWALAAVISIKAVIYLPALAVLLVAARPARALRAAAAFGVVAAGVWFALHAGHAAGLAVPPASSPADRIAAVAPGMWLQPRWGVLADTLARDWAFWLLFAAGIAVAVRAALVRTGPARARALGALALGLPVATVLVYRNGYEYFYVALVPGAAVLAGLAASRLGAALAGRTRFAGVALASLALPALGVAATFYATHRSDATLPQRTVLAAVHHVFPAPVPYLDRCSMVAGFPKVGPFMSSFVLGAYRARGVPIMEDLVRRRRPVFVLANVTGLDLAAPWPLLAARRHRLLRVDFEALQRHYVHHWGPLWVAGRAFTLAAGATTSFHVPVPGRYTVESAVPVALDGVARRGGEVVTLDAGAHTVSSTTAASVTLRWGAHLPRPRAEPPVGPLFDGL